MSFGVEYGASIYGVRLLIEREAYDGYQGPVSLLVMLTPFGVTPYCEDHLRKQIGPSESMGSGD
ncbi:MAG: hypothetical protein ABI693_02325 [Bryobacteraceae bacterium]